MADEELGVQDSHGVTGNTTEAASRSSAAPVLLVPARPVASFVSRLFALSITFVNPNFANFVGLNFLILNA